MKAIQKAILGAMISIVVLWGSSAMAADGYGSMYKAGNNVIGVGYSSLTPSFASFTYSGVNVHWTYFLTESLAFNLQGHFLSGTAPAGVFTPIPSGGAVSLNSMVIQAEYHLGFGNNFGLYGGIGYASSPGTVGSVSTSDTGFEYEAGLEYKFTDNFIGNAGYKYIGLAGGLSVGGITAAVSFLF